MIQNAILINLHIKQETKTSILYPPSLTKVWRTCNVLNGIFLLSSTKPKLNHESVHLTLKAALSQNFALSLTGTMARAGRTLANLRCRQFLF